ncbi:hypothetical protein ACFL3V_03965 [Nanoarchaeota archaeon]
MDSEKREELVKIVSQLVNLLSDEVKSQVVLPLPGEQKGFPISIFRSNLSSLEAIILYLKDTKNMSTKEISTLLKRNVSTIYTTYQNAKNKIKGELDTSDFSITVPIDTFADRNFSILESLISYLKDKQGLNLANIARLLGKSYSTIKTTYRRYQEKCVQKRTR